VKGDVVISLKDLINVGGNKGEYTSFRMDYTGGRKESKRNQGYFTTEAKNGEGCLRGSDIELG